MTQEALLPYRVPFARPAGVPRPLAYLDEASNNRAGSLSIDLEVQIQSDRMLRDGTPPARVSRTNFRHQSWTFAQMLAHHTVGGCRMNSGDVIGSGTISGPEPGEAGSILELALGGRRPVTLGDSGESRSFLEDGDTVILKAWCERKNAARIGFGECRGTVLPAAEDD